VQGVRFPNPGVHIHDLAGRQMFIRMTLRGIAGRPPKSVVFHHPNQLFERDRLILEMEAVILKVDFAVVSDGVVFPALRNQNHRFLLSKSGSTAEPEPQL
jgi:hypothetical protein